MGADGCRSVCSSSQPPDQGLLQLPSRSGGDGSGCFLSEQESHTSVCIPSIPTSGKNPLENETRESGGSGNNCPSLAKAAVVSITTGDDTISRPTYLSPTVERSVTEPIEDNPPSTEGEPSTLGRMEGVRNSLQKQGISGDAADIICSSWRKSTEKSYSSAWNKWSGWCEERTTDPFSATIAEIADFLTHQFRDGKQYSTINSYRSAISNTHPHIEGYPTGKHPIICRLMRGVFNERPSEPKYSEIGISMKSCYILNQW